MISTLKLGKAAESDGVHLEDLVYGSNALICHLTVLYVKLCSCHIPASFLHGLLVPISTGNDKYLQQPTNYRGITILSKVGKFFEKLVLLKIHQQGFLTLNPLQGGFREHLSCIHTAYVAHEAVQTLRESGCKAYMALLDVQKHFIPCSMKG